MARESNTVMAVLALTMLSNGCGSPAVEPDASAADAARSDDTGAPDGWVADGGPPGCAAVGGEACFEMPTGVLAARAETGVDPVTPRFSCAPPTAQLSTVEVTVSGRIADFLAGDPIPGATFDVYSDVALTTEILHATAGADGTYSVILPAGAPDLIHSHASSEGYLDTYGFYFRVDLTGPTLTQDGLLLTSAAADTAARLARVTRAPRTAVMLVDLLDCDGLYLEHAIATLSSTSGEPVHVAGPVVLYAPDGMAPVLARRDQRHESSDNGTAVIVNVPVELTEAYVQVWGFLDEAALARGAEGLTLVAEQRIPLFPDSSIGVEMWPTTSP